MLIGLIKIVVVDYDWVILVGFCRNLFLCYLLVVVELVILVCFVDVICDCCVEIVDFDIVLYCLLVKILLWV